MEPDGRINGLKGKERKCFTSGPSTYNKLKNHYSDETEKLLSDKVEKVVGDIYKKINNFMEMEITEIELGQKLILRAFNLQFYRQPKIIDKTNDMRKTNRVFSHSEYLKLIDDKKIEFFKSNEYFATFMYNDTEVGFVTNSLGMYFKKHDQSRMIFFPISNEVSLLLVPKKNGLEHVFYKPKNKDEVVYYNRLAQNYSDFFDGDIIGFKKDLELLK